MYWWNDPIIWIFWVLLAAFVFADMVRAHRENKRHRIQALERTQEKRLDKEYDAWAKNHGVRPKVKEKT